LAYLHDEHSAEPSAADSGGTHPIPQGRTMRKPAKIALGIFGSILAIIVIAGVANAGNAAPASALAAAPAASTAPTTTPPPAAMAAAPVAPTADELFVAAVVNTHELIGVEDRREWARDIIEHASKSDLPGFRDAADSLAVAQSMESVIVLMPAALEMAHACQANGWNAQDSGMVSG
jgi:hypothetical protein